MIVKKCNKIKYVWDQKKVNKINMLHPVLDAYYPTELLPYYKEVYNNICYEYNIPVFV